MNEITCLEDWKGIKPATKVYFATKEDLELWYFVGFHPKSPLSVILVSGRDTFKVKTYYEGHVGHQSYFTVEKLAYARVVELAQKNLEDMIAVYGNQEPG